MRDLQRFDNDSVYDDPRGLAKLQAAALEQAEEVRVQPAPQGRAGNESLALSGSDEVPAGFRQAIEEYYRSLAKKQPQK